MGAGGGADVKEIIDGIKDVALSAGGLIIMIVIFAIEISVGYIVIETILAVFKMVIEAIPWL